MADTNKLELVVEVDVNKANASIKSINTGLSSIEQAAGRAARGASVGIDGLTVSMVKGAAAGNLLADSIQKALDWAQEWTLGAAQHAAHTDKMSMSMAALARAHGVERGGLEQGGRSGQKGRLRDAGRNPCRRPAHGRGHEPVESGLAGQDRQGRRRHRKHHARRGAGETSYGHRVGRFAQPPDHG